MCGITGIIHPESNLHIDALTMAIAHRGPDDFGIFNLNNLSLGHRRLSIQDTSENGHQPMFTADGRYCIVFNGEIYNHWDIRKELNSKYSFRSTSDTETLLYGYIEYGTAIFNKLNGIFAFAIFDKLTHDLIIVRDQFGVKPLYYYTKDNTFIFSSEIKGINTFSALDRKIDPKGILNYIRFLWSPGERTPFEHVKKLLPCHYLKVNIDTPSVIENVKYYTIPFTGKYDVKTEKQWIDALDEHLYSAVKRQLLSDVPFGFFLSGGLDSSAIIAMAKRALPHQRLQCYTIDSGSMNMSKEGFSDDLYYARKVADFLNVDLKVIDGRMNIMQKFDKMVWHLDEPQADVAPLHILNICMQARKDGYVVLLGGTAGDDIFSGYRRHQALNYERIFRNIPSLVLKAGKIIINKIHSSNVTIRRIKKIFVNINNSDIDRQVGYFSWISNISSKSLLHSKYQEELKDYDPINILKDTYRHIPDEQSSLNKMLYLEIKYFLPDHNLNYTDKLSMAVGVEVRVPFLDKELVEFSTRIPPGLKMKGSTTKYLLRKVMERYLPHDIIYRPKAGFGSPIRTWIKNEMSEYIDNMFSKQSIDENKIFNYNAIRSLIKDNWENKYDASYTILSLLSIISWIKQFVGKAKD